MNKPNFGPLRSLGPITPELVVNYLMSRSEMAKSQEVGHSDSLRDMDKDCNYPEAPNVQTYQTLYQRGDVAARVVDVWPLETWKQKPKVFEVEDEDTETPFEEEWEKVQKKHRLFSKMLRLDCMCGVGHYAVIFFGLPGSADQAAPGWDKEKRQWGDKAPTGTPLAYARVFDETQARISAYELDPQHERYGLPTMYSLTIVDRQNRGQGSAAEPNITLDVHHSRLVHVADNLTSSEVEGQPRMQNVLNRLLDIRKISGGSGEMFWRGGFPGYSFEVDPKNQEVELDTESIKDEMQAFSDGLQRYLALVGVKVNSLSPQVADPTPHVDMNLKLIAITKGIPLRILTGSEQAHLASSQDQKEWNGRVTTRQDDFAIPCIAQPIVELLLHTGVLPPLTAPAEAGDGAKNESAEVTIKFPDLNTVTDTEKADILVKRTQALTAYTSGNARLLVPPLEFLIKFMGMSMDEAVATLEAALEEIADPESNINVGKQQAIDQAQEIGAANGNPAAGNGPGNKAQPPNGKPAAALGPTPAKTKPAPAKQPAAV